MRPESDEHPAVRELRSALTPRASDKARVLDLIERRLAANGSGSGSPPASASRWTLDSSTQLRRAANALPAKVLPWVGALMSGAVALSIALWFAPAHDRPAGSSTTPGSIPRAQPAVATPVRAPTFSPALPTTPVEQPTAAAGDGIGARSTRTGPEAAQRHARGAHPRSPLVASSARTQPLPPPDDATSAQREDDDDAALHIELDALERAQRALLAGQPALALEILAQCARAVPRGRMREERVAASVVARCALPGADNRALIEAFTEAWPHSAYALRVRRGCEPRGVSP